LEEKRLFDHLGIPVAPYRPVDSADDLAAALREIGVPAVLKTRRLGYDGRGQRFIREHGDAAAAWAALGGVPMVLEGFVPFDREVSLIGVRAVSGETRFYPLAENVHGDGILRYSRAPFDHGEIQAAAESHVDRLLSHFAYAGVLTVEFFVREGRLLANEMAPRVHNSGHWTIDFLGHMPPVHEVLAIPNARFHDYGKTPRPGRKLGHCTVVCATSDDRDQALNRVLALAGA
jgi:5-(carboxyamino)imidazole ribonucleotide synthase